MAATTHAAADEANDAKAKQIAIKMRAKETLEVQQLEDKIKAMTPARGSQLEEVASFDDLPLSEATRKRRFCHHQCWNGCLATQLTVFCVCFFARFEGVQVHETHQNPDRRHSPCARRARHPRGRQDRVGQDARFVPRCLSCSLFATSLFPLRFFPLYSHMHPISISLCMQRF